MVQLDICVFHQCLTKDILNAMLDIQSSSWAEELLDEGLLLCSLQKQEKVEWRWQVPFYLHINLELLDVYDSISMETLSNMLELDLPTVHSIISKMTINKLIAFLDQPIHTVVMYCMDPTAQQNLALQLVENLGSLVENSEHVFDQKQGTYGGYFRDKKDGYQKNEGTRMPTISSSLKQPTDHLHPHNLDHSTTLKS
ncbi:hypothetical protein HJG60_008581 [Phyllostomus discolor]|uniref:Eukaryotic translation initiation factor 3 subunit C N-terminal domain-containing protein n=1 Tax=Phyllostomus discolor TaxID=89673 RepID=A0A833Z3Q0_9CHIR|nr:hypothetical protein HJG60_008581 [Phyllostomus discolor]